MKRLIDADALYKEVTEKYHDINAGHYPFNIVAYDMAQLVKNAPTIDAVELPKGKPGDYLEWNNGAGFTRIYYIHSVMICEDCIRYDLDAFAPVISHPCIVRILTREEAEAAIAERKDYGE